MRLTCVTLASPLLISCCLWTDLSVFCFSACRRLRWLSWLWPAALTQHLPARPQDLRFRRGPRTDDRGCICQGLSLSSLPLSLLSASLSLSLCLHHVYTVPMCACMQGLLALEGELTPILVQMVKSANMNGLLDSDSDSLTDCQQRVKAHLHEIMQKDQDFSQADYEKVHLSVDLVSGFFAYSA